MARAVRTLEAPFVCALLLALAAARPVEAQPPVRSGESEALDGSPREGEPDSTDRADPSEPSAAERDGEPGDADRETEHENGRGGEAGGAEPSAEPDEGTPVGAERSRPIRYVIERIDVRGNARTDTGVIRSFVSLREGELVDTADPRFEATRWRLYGTGWFDEVRLRLERGSRRGRVVLVIDVRERNTFVVQGLALGISEGVLNSLSPNTQIEPYFGISLAETNLFGTGVGLSATALLSMPQQGFRLRAGVAGVAGSDWGLTGAAFFNNGREFFGNEDVIIAVDECPPLTRDMRCEEGLAAVVLYRRYGGSIGTGIDIGNTLRFTLDYQLEAVEVIDRPAAASHTRGTEIVPIDFAIHDGLSWVSSLQLGLVDDERDDPALPTQGRHVYVRADVSSTLIGSAYDFVRVQGSWREWFRLPAARHTLRLGLFLGAAVGDVPFFYKFYVGDLSDLIPARVLELNLDRRAPPNLLDTAVREMRAEEIAGRFDIEYALWVYESHDALRALQIYGLIGVYALADDDDFRLGIPGYSGFARVPIDLTFDIGMRFDTVVGVFQIGFSTLLGFISI